VHLSGPGDVIGELLDCLWPVEVVLGWCHHQAMQWRRGSGYGGTLRLSVTATVCASSNGLQAVITRCR
jgi:hypothetical protein